MPELPDLEVICEYLRPRLLGAEVAAVQIRRPIIVRDLIGEPLAGRRFTDVTRRGKFLLMALDGNVTMVLNPMLAGRLRYGEPLARDRVRDAVVILLTDGLELRYHDAADMGKLYLTGDPERVPGFAGMGPEANDPDLTLERFHVRLRRFRGEIKGVLTDQAFVAGIGNAYSDEICWSARIYPFRRRADLSANEIAVLYEAMRAVLAEATATLRVRVGSAIEVEIRDFLAVHGKVGQPCPRCGSTISRVSLARSSTDFCRTCQPGLMIERRRGTKRPGSQTQDGR